MIGLTFCSIIELPLERENKVKVFLTVISFILLTLIAAVTITVWTPTYLYITFPVGAAYTAIVIIGMKLAYPDKDDSISEGEIK